jgi:hypothetical protein
VDVKLCNKTTQSQDVSDSYWTLQAADSVEYEKANYQDFAMPRQPVYGDKTVRPNKCTRGWISFEVQRDQSPVLAVYDNESLHAEWTIKK